ncbi:MAG: AraC family transcriptional regulator [Prevotella sp.]|nr:AraC family transcriptional regulator [Prevotella sp.]
MSTKNYSDKKLLKNLSQLLHKEMAEGKVNVKTLAKQMAISTCQLNRRVKEATGQTTSDYVLDIRLKEAKRLLGMFPDVTISDTARRCGFADTAHFSHVFRRKEGVSPSQYIQRQKNPIPPKNVISSDSIQDMHPLDNHIS